MRIEHHHTVTVTVTVNSTADQATLDKLNQILGLLGVINQREVAMAQDITALTDSVAQVKGTEASIKEAIGQIVALSQAQAVKIQQLIDAAGQGGVDPAALQAVVDDLNATNTALTADKQAIADAVAANPVP